MVLVRGLFKARRATALRGVEPLSLAKLLPSSCASRLPGVFSSALEQVLLTIRFLPQDAQAADVPESCRSGLPWLWQSLNLPQRPAEALTKADMADPSRTMRCRSQPKQLFIATKRRYRTEIKRVCLVHLGTSSGN